MTYVMVFNFLRNTHAQWIPLITVAYLLTFLTVITITQTQNLTFRLLTMRTFLVVSYVGEQLKSRTFSSDSENESNDRGG